LTTPYYNGVSAVTAPVPYRASHAVKFRCGKRCVGTFMLYKFNSEQIIFNGNIKWLYFLLLSRKGINLLIDLNIFNGELHTLMSKPFNHDE